MRRGNHIEYNIITDDKLPFETNSICLAYTSHTIEHLKDEFIQRMFNEVYRCLEKGGVFRVTCPDADLFYTAMRMNTFDRFFHRRRAWFEKTSTPEDKVEPLDYIKMAFATALSTTPILRDENPLLWEDLKQKSKELLKEEFLDYLTNQVEFDINRIGCHINWWNGEKLTKFLRSSGFQHVRISTYGGSVAAPMCDINLFDNTMPDESVYVEAYK